MTAAAARAADAVAADFERYHRAFRDLTRRAKRRFEERDWSGIRADTVERLALHGRAVQATRQALERRWPAAAGSRDFWVTLKQRYLEAVLGRDDFEVALTYFNSLVRQAFPHDGVDPELDFLGEDFPAFYRGWEMSSARTYAVRGIDPAVVKRVLASAGFEIGFADLEGDAAGVATALARAMDEAWGEPSLDALDVLRPVLLRNKAAYLVGRVRRGERVVPFMLSILNDEGGLAVDAVLAREEDISIVFSFARWYFHAEVENPREVIGFLHSLLPRKRVAELYISLGYNKHGKTELYRDLTATIANADPGERFVIAPGKPGLVMSVFTLPSYEFVFKVIRDVFPSQKPTTPDEVKARYSEVLRHDRVGRLVDFQAFEHLQFPRQRFSPELLEELAASASSTVELKGETVVIHHLYVGRRVTPLDVYLESATPAAAAQAVIDWGQALKDLAAANVFAGDMLLKNFGVTRHGRVVFYDYDEICALTDCRFRKIPPSRSPEDELAPEPWFSVGAHDIFPEELRSFMTLSPELMARFEERHADLFEPTFWRRLQERNRAREIIDFFPYAENRRLGAPPTDVPPPAAATRALAGSYRREPA